MKRTTKGSRLLMAGLLSMLMIILLWQPVCAEDVKVIANPSVPDATLSQNMIKAVFLGNRTTWSDGRSIEFVTLVSGDVHKAFLKKFVKKTPIQFSTYWKWQVYTGKGFSPKAFATQIELIDYVAAHDGSVGYVSGDADVTAVKVLSQK
jgi:ABC-type phosphate transport system substrate-binding protein